MIGCRLPNDMDIRSSCGFPWAGAKDFTLYILKVKAAGVDAILCMANVPETVTLVRQMKGNILGVKYFRDFKGTWCKGFMENISR
jgi:ABC-type branched-subunit amino acid transport system substrate-binding protein